MAAVKGSKTDRGFKGVSPRPQFYAASAKAGGAQTRRLGNGPNRETRQKVNVLEFKGETSKLPFIHENG
jgi:hypothetical protein